MANVRKFSNMKDIGHLCKHYERSVANDNYGNADIDKSKLELDRTNLAPDRGNQTDYIKAQIEKIMNGSTLRKDAVKMACWVVDAPNGMPEEKREQFFNDVYDFLVDRYGKKSGMGEDVVISAYIHRSETTEHMHFAFLPVLEKDGKKSFCARDLINRQELKVFHEELGDYLENTGICKKTDILNGKTQRDSNGRALSVKELKRRTRERERKVDRWNVQRDEKNREREW